MILHARPIGSETGTGVGRQRGVLGALGVCKKCRITLSKSDLASPGDSLWRWWVCEASCCFLFYMFLSYKKLSFLLGSPTGFALFSFFFVFFLDFVKRLQVSQLLCKFLTFDKMF